MLQVDLVVDFVDLGLYKSYFRYVIHYLIHYLYLHVFACLRNAIDLNTFKNDRWNND